MAPEDALVGPATIFDDTPIEMLLAIFATFGTTQKHDGVGGYRKNPGREWGRSALQALLRKVTL